MQAAAGQRRDPSRGTAVRPRAAVRDDRGLGGRKAPPRGLAGPL